MRRWTPDPGEIAFYILAIWIMALLTYIIVHG